MKLEVGKYYKTRSGLKAKIVSDELFGNFDKFAAIVYDTNNCDVHPYDEFGNWGDSEKEYKLDLIKEWTDPFEIEFKCHWHKITENLIYPTCPQSKLTPFLGKETLVTIKEIK